MCVACISPFIPDYDGQACIDPLENCLDVFVNLGKPGYEIVEGLGYRCTLCEDGFYWDDSNWACTPCQDAIEDCTLCSTESGEAFCNLCGRGPNDLN